MRESVKWFAEEMESALSKKDAIYGGDDWECCTYSYLISRLLEETAEMVKAIDERKPKEEIMKECADIANFAMMIADNTRSNATD